MSVYLSLQYKKISPLVQTVVHVPAQGRNESTEKKRKYQEKKMKLLKNIKIKFLFITRKDLYISIEELIRPQSGPRWEIGSTKTLFQLLPWGWMQNYTT